MDEVNRRTSNDSQHQADQRASSYTFQTIKGWMKDGGYPCYAEEHEKMTIMQQTTLIMSVKGKNKKMATIVSPVLSNCSSLSGWKDDHSHLTIISSQLWTRKGSDIISTMDIQLPKHPLDYKFEDGWDGKFHASHAEAKLLMFYLDFYINQSEALHFLGSALNWNTKIVDISVSDSICSTCSEIARRMYEKHYIMVNFIVRGRIVYPECKNHYCKRELLNGLRVFCDNCQTQVDYLPTICLDLPQMYASDFDKLIRRSAADHASLSEHKDFFYKILQAILTIPLRGLHLFGDGALSESGLTVIVPHPHSEEFADEIEGFIDRAINEDCLENRPSLRARTRQAAFSFIKSLQLPELSNALGNFDDFPWKAVVITREEAFGSDEQHISLVDELSLGLGQLHVDDHSLAPSMSFWGDELENSNDDDCYSEGERESTGTDEEVERANAADDGIKIIEGDW